MCWEWIVILGMFTVVSLIGNIRQECQIKMLKEKLEGNT